ncbi:MAG: hypothetical protein ACRDHW_13465 [Ktedonobacteraceae bacterium]
MQKVSFRKVETTVSLPKPTDEIIMHFDMTNLLPDGQLLALNTKLGTIALLTCQTETPHPILLSEQQFSVNELRVLLPLLQLHPHYCPYEVLLASFYVGNTDEATVERFRLRLQEAQFAGVWDYEMRPARNILSRIRFKLRDLNIEISSILETGYLLIYAPPRQPREIAKI